MPILTDFSFRQDIPSTSPQVLGLDAPQPDLLGLLRGFVGPTPKRGDAALSWKGTGFNMIWRPNLAGGGEFGNLAHFLQLNMTEETLDFTEITGTGIANRSLFEQTIVLGAAAYTQAIKDSFDDSGQHFEPGVWANVPATANPLEPTTVTRMGSIPHGTTVNMQGVAFTAAAPQFDVSSIVPFKIGSPDDGKTNLVPFVEQNLSIPSTSRTDLARVATLTQAQLNNPNLFLEQAIAGQTIRSTVVIQISSQSPDVSGVPTAPDAGGGTANIAFLTGTQSGPNAVVPKVTATFWIEEVDNGKGGVDLQLQYTQRVLLDFSGLSWPHVTVATLRPVKKIL